MITTQEKTNAADRQQIINLPTVEDAIRTAASVKVPVLLEPVPSAAPQTVSDTETVLNNAAYLLDRINPLNLTTEEAAAHGLTADADGNILQAYRAFNGEPIEYLPQFGKDATRRHKLESRRSISPVDVENFTRPLVLIRHNPAAVAAGQPKYKFPSKAFTGFSPMPMPTNTAIQAHNDGKTGGTVLGIEGYFKAVALSLEGVESFAFSGISTYKLCDSLKDYLLQRQPDRLVISYDADALDTRTENGTVKAKRVFDFYFSAYRFAVQFFKFAADNDLPTDLYFSVLKPNDAAKGADDLLQTLQPDQRAALAADVSECRADSPYFDFLKLSKTTAEKKLKTYFGLSNYREFYNRRRDAIGNNPFSFSGATYQMHRQPGKLFGVPFEFLRLLDTPFTADSDSSDHVVKKYISDARKHIDTAIEQNNSLAIEAPTGSGKTTFFLNYAKRTGQRVVIAVPYVSLAKQLGQERGVYALHGKIDHRRIETALNSDVVVCTYDLLHRIADLQNRVLIIDEAHNLVNHFGEVRRRLKLFRADTLRTVLRLSQKAQKRVFISGTMPRLLCTALDIPLMSIRQRTPQQINVRPIEADRQSELAALTLSQLEKQNFDDGKIRFVLWNNRKHLQTIKDGLIKSGILDAADIAIVTRTDVNNGSGQTYGQVTSKAGQVTGVKLVLCTCLIAEGVNIKNKNVGDVFAVGVNDADLIRQFAARFRALDAVNLILILQPENDVKKGFSFTAVGQIADALDISKIQKRGYLRERTAHLADYEPADLEFYDNIKPTYDYLSRELSTIYIDAAGQPQTDILRICADVKQRELDTSNNAYLLSRLSEISNFSIHKAGEAGNVTEQAETLAAVKEAEKTAKKESIDRAKRLLTDCPAKVVKAYQLHAERTGNRHAQKFLNTTVPDLLDTATDADALFLLDLYAEDFTRDYYRRLVRDFCLMHFLGLTDTDKAAELAAYRAGDFARKFKAVRTCIELALYGSKRHRLHLQPLHRADLKTRKAIAAAIDELTKGADTLTAKDLTAAIQTIYSRKRFDGANYTEVVERAAAITAVKAKAIFAELYDFEEVEKGRFKIVGRYYDFDKNGTTEKVPFLQNRTHKQLLKLLKIIELRN